MPDTMNSPSFLPEPFDCVVIGDSPLLAECVRHLLDQGNRIGAVVTADPDLRAWAEGLHLPLETFDGGLVERLSGRPVDYLFSIANLRILPQALLDLPRRLAINFHDGPLPRHAGLFATSWAIIDGDRLHGVTWHVMTAEADAGDILEQRAVAVADDDTAWSLNARCLEAGAASFAALIAGLRQGTVVPRPQDLSQRTYHGRTDGPPDGGVLSWDRPGEALAAHVRACRFGPHPNGFGDALLDLGRDMVIVGEAWATSSRSGAEPGTILGIVGEYLTVATSGTDVRVGGFQSLEGAPFPVADLVSRHGLAVGLRLPGATAAQREERRQRARVLARHEAVWVDRLARRHPLRFDGREFAAGPGVAPDWTLPPASLRELRPDRPEVAVLAAFLAFLVRLCGPEFRIGLSGWSGRWSADPAIGPDDPVIAADWPLVPPSMADGATLGVLAARVAEDLATLGAHPGYRRTALARHPRLRPGGAADPQSWPVAVALVAQREDPPPEGAGIPRDGLLLRISVRDGAWRFAGPAGDGTLAGAFQRRFGAFLETASPEADPWLLPLMDATERQTMLTDWCGETTDEASAPAVQDLVAAAIRRHPDRIAIRAGDQSESYGALGRRIDRRREEIARSGVRSGGRVAVYLDRSIDLPATLLAVLGLGAAYVPLDPIFPARRIADILEDAGVDAVVTERALLDTLPPGCPAPVVVIDDPEVASPVLPAVAPDPGDGARAGAAPDGLAYVIFTSGSTGRPKGVEVLHRGLSNLLLSIGRRLGFTSAHRFAAVTTVTFDIAALELFLPLIAGGELDLLSRDTAADGIALAAHLAHRKPDVMQATPATWRMLLAAGWDGDPDLTLLCGGERLPDDLADLLCNRVRAAWNMYGPTETTIWSSMARLVPNGRITIGRPIANTRFLVLDERMQLLPPGIPGELYIGGDGLAAGYNGRPDLTARAFVADPFGAGRLYRTGDRAVWAANGEMLFLGRLDAQVKLRGYRIELGEIETALRRHPGVADAAVQLHDGGARGAELIAYAVAASGAALPPDLRNFLRGQLPDYAVPSRVVQLAALPRLSNGKLDRSRLRPAGGAARPEAGTSGGAGPAVSDPVAAAISAIWCAVLATDGVGLDENFFDAGGNSLLLTELVVRLNREMAAAITRMDMFRFPTIRTMAAHLGSRAAETGPAFSQSASVERRRRLDLLQRRGR